jgi:hypothetical protein
METENMTHEQTLRGALLQLCSRTSKAWRRAAVSGSDPDMEHAQRLSIVADELARTYEDAVGDFDDVLDAHGEAFGLASDVMCEWEWDEIDKNVLCVMMLECSKAYADVANAHKEK